MQHAHALQLEVMEEALALKEAARHLRAVLQQPRAAGIHHRRKWQVLPALCAVSQSSARSHSGPESCVYTVAGSDVQGGRIYKGSQRLVQIPHGYAGKHAGRSR